MKKDEFNNKIKISKETSIAIEGVSEAYKNQGRKLEEKDKNKLIKYLKTLNRE